MGMEMTMTTRWTVSVHWQHVRMVIIVIVLVLLSVTTHGHGDTTLLDALLPRV
ncbi:hypothetical protein ACFYP4_29490 [Streptomyces sp. NPDC005551]|uniref:hypothetical protein n=1 Tax=unclassified Streptomyces TaxID=2593676 RepID=UPI0033DE5E33